MVMSIKFIFALEDRTVRKNVDRRTSGLWSLLFRDLSPSLPRRTFEDLGERQLIGAKTQLLPNEICYAVPALRLTKLCGSEGTYV